MVPTLCTCVQQKNTINSGCLYALFADFSKATSYGRVFQKIAVSWKIHISQNLILSAEASWIVGCSCRVRFARVNFVQHVGPTTRLGMMLKLQKIPKYMKRLTRSQSITPPNGPRTRADHGADSAAGHPGRMRNRFRPFRCSWVRGS